MHDGSWAVVATVDEPSALIISFAAQHLAQGAAEVHLYFDRPNPVAQVALQGLDRCHITLCDAAYWQNSPRGRRPNLHVGRQKVNAARAYGQVQTDWLLHCDCDEFIRDGAALRAALARVPADAAYLRLPMAERVALADQPQSSLFDGVFRVPFPSFDLIGEGIYGRLAPMLKDGITGHAAGKAVMRCGIGLEMGLHAPGGGVAFVTADTVRLLHFDGLTRLHYALKLMRRALEPVSDTKTRHNRARTAQFRALSDMVVGGGDVWPMVDALKTLTRRQAQVLRGLGHLEDTPFDPGAALLQFGLSSDLSPAAFNTELRARDAEFIVSSGLRE